MRLLLDTHALLWWFTNDPKLSATAQSAIADTDNTIFVSAASAWEIATKQRIVKKKHVWAPSRWPPKGAHPGCLFGAVS